jgi:DNA-binding XRE family transcriptional regulator
MIMLMTRPEPTHIGARLWAARRRLDLTQAALGDLVGVNQTTIGRWEVGASLPDVVQLLELCAVLELNPADVLAPLAA